MATFFVLVLLALLLAGAWGAISVIRRFENATAPVDGASKDD